MTARKKARASRGRKPNSKTKPKAPKKRRAVTKKVPAARQPAGRRPAPSKKSKPKVRAGRAPKKAARRYPPRPLTRPVRPTGILKRQGIKAFRKRLGKELARVAEVTHVYAKKLRKKTRAVKKSRESALKKKRRLAGLKGYSTRLGHDRSGYRVKLETDLTGDLAPSERHFIRREMMRTNHPIFRSYIEDMLDLGWDYEDAIDEWFSPEGE